MQWEYTDVAAPQHGGDFIKQLNKLGAQGWEVVSETNAHGHRQALMKRLVSDGFVATEPAGAS